MGPRGRALCSAVLAAVLADADAALRAAVPAASGWRAAPHPRAAPARRATAPQLTLSPPEAAVTAAEDVAAPAFDGSVHGWEPLADGPLRPLRVLFRFSRPHTIVGSAMCIPALTLFAAPLGSLPTLAGPLASAALYALAPALLMNLYIVGLNQLFDIELDKVNKPYLPLASGDLGPAAGAAVVGGALLCALALGFAHPTLSTGALRATLVGSAALGTAYSLPPLRLKRSPLAAGLCIMTVRGALVNWGFFTHAATVAARSTAAAGAGAAASALQGWRCAAPVAFFTLFGTVIALVKDVPDVRGDALFGIRSFSVRAGPERVLRLAIGLLCATYVGAAVALGLGAAAAPTAAVLARRASLSVGALATAGYVHRRASGVAPAQSGEVYSLYMALWRCFYTAYVCLPLAR